MKLKTNYYQLLNFAAFPDTKINKYCYQCNKFISNENSLSHKHKAIINAADYIYNCKFHKTEILIGFCKDCKKLICGICLNDNLHKNHKIEYTKDLAITEEILKEYETNLKNAFLEMNNLIKLKYDNNSIKLKMINIFEEENFDYKMFNSKDQQILKSLQLLKTFLDLYKSYKNNNFKINYQIITNILKHTNFEILRINDNKTFNNQNKLNKNINIFLKINLKIDKKNDKTFKIISFKKIKLNQFIIKKILIKLKKGALFFFMITSMENKIIFYKNFKENKNYIEVNDKIIDFILLENGNVVIYLSNKILIYKFSKDIFSFEKLINLGNNIEYYNLSHLCDNNFSIFSHEKDKKKICLNYFIHPNYEAKKFSLQEAQSDRVVPASSTQIDKTIIIGIDSYLEYLYKIIFYDLIEKKLECIKIKKNIKILIIAVLNYLNLNLIKF